ncbi:transposase [Reticulomyxa filosa]|uniref:Transposase n=1 Tax=Reticulomyxa filosa TaxID=46433 RepID=X6LC34_RETFI|nr:transposase [Reticulomyxa filosa]|eukprot:ETN98299.1 transposase [Reticulomyxa filosa]
MKKEIENDSPFPTISVSTCKRTLYRAGFRGRSKIKKPYLKKILRQKRLIFAINYKNWTIEEWKKVLWSDESKVSVFDSNDRQYCWRKRGEPIQDSHVIPTIKHGGGSLMIWGCMTWYGVGFLCKIDNTLDAALYQTILGDELTKTLEWYQMEKLDIIFQHDNDPKHTAKSTQK